ncbi:MAG: bifunctional nuclease family protein [candidate division KSB1 bacterium]|nr:bifunctional nuclease family protein [candidate division KSB1 bacterium]
MLIRVSVIRVSLDTSSSGRFIVILKEDDRNRWLPIVVGQPEAQAIAMQLENIEPPRPLTHDLVCNLLSLLDCRVERVIINDLRDNTFYAVMKLDVDGEKKELDLRPSDAIAVALRVRAPIYVESELMDLAGISESDLETREEVRESRHENPLSLVDVIEELHISLHKAIQEERYEEAARIRDEIAKLREEFRHNADV